MRRTIVSSQHRLKFELEWCVRAATGQGMPLWLDRHCYSLGWAPSSLLNHGSQRWEDYLAVGYLGTADARVLVDADENEPAARR